MDINTILQTVNDLNSRASVLNENNNKKKIEKEYARKDLIKALANLKEINPDLNLDLEDPNFETNLANIKNEVLLDIQKQSEHLEQVISAQEQNDLPKLEKLLGIHLGRVTVSSEIKLEELQGEKSEEMPLDLNSSKEKDSSEAKTETSESVETKPEPKQVKGLFDNISATGGTEAVESKTTKETVVTEETVTEEEPTEEEHIQNVSDVQNMFKGLVGKGISPENDTTEEKEEVKEEKEESKETTAGNFDFGSFFGKK